MKTAKIITVSFCISLVLGMISCNNGEGLMNLLSQKAENLDINKDFQTIEVQGEYSLKVPSYMKADTALHPDASLAYQHAVKEVATLVLDEYTSEIKESLPYMDGYSDSSSFIENYTNIQLNLIAEGLLYPEFGEIHLKEIDEYPASQVWMEGRIDGMDIAYFITCVLANEKIYFVMSYTSKEKKTKFGDTFQKIGDSFTILSHVKDEATE